MANKPNKERLKKHREENNQQITNRRSLIWPVFAAEVEASGETTLQLIDEVLKPVSGVFRLMVQKIFDMFVETCQLFR